MYRAVVSGGQQVPQLVHLLLPDLACKLDLARPVVSSSGGRPATARAFLQPAALTLTPADLSLAAGVLPRYYTHTHTPSPPRIRILNRSKYLNKATVLL